MALAFRIKVYTEIVSGMFNSIRSSIGAVADLNPGSWIRTILEAASLQDADQYAQVGKLLDFFALDTLEGDDIDRRALDFGTLFQINLQRQGASQSHALVCMRDTNFTQVTSVLANNTPAGVSVFAVATGTGAVFPTAGRVTLDRGTTHEESFYFSRTGDAFSALAGYVLQFGHLAGATVDLTSVASTITNNIAISGTTVNLAAGTGAAFPAAGNIILSRETSNRELLAFTRAGDVLTITTGGGATKTHAIGDSAILSTVGVDRTANAGAEVDVPATIATVLIAYTLDTGITLLDGDYQSSLVGATSKLVGSATIAGAGTIISFAVPPFSTAVPFNPSAATQGRDRETDVNYIQRIKDTIQSLAGLTALTITTKVNGLQDPVSQAIVGFAQLVDAVSPGFSLLYVTDGSTTFSPSPLLVSGRELLINVASGGDRRARLIGPAPVVVISSPGLQLPAPPVIAQVGTAGGTTYGYAVVAKVGVGVAPSATQTTAVGNATLNGTNYNQLSFIGVAGAQSYDIYRVIGGATTGKIGNVVTVPNQTQYTFNDTGLAGDSTAVPTTNTTVTNSTAITPRLFRDTFRGTSTAVGPGFLEDSSQNFGVNALIGMWVKSSDGVFHQITSNSAIRMNFSGGTTPPVGGYAVFDFTQPPLIPTVDYTINDTTGDLSLTVPLVQYGSLVAADDNNASAGAYIKSSGLLAYVQKVVNGDKTDVQNFPGLKAPGTSVRVVAPAIVSPQFIIRAVPKNGALDSTFISAVTAAASRYVNSLGVGETILLSRIITDCENDVGNLDDIEILSPPTNVPVADGQLARVSNTNFSIV
jgi:hypothetical protein